MPSRTPTPRLLSILGPTASGKTRLAVALARRRNGEILSADSRQVYRGMDIGTGKDLADYCTPQGTVPHHLIDILDAGQKYTLFDYQRDFYAAHAEILTRGRQPILCGGSGMYAEAIIRGYQLVEVPPDPALRARLEQCTHQELVEHLKAHGPLHNQTDIQSRKRLIRAIEIATLTAAQSPAPRSYPPVSIGPVFAIDLPRELRRERISLRLRVRLDEGLIEEVQRLIDRGVPIETLLYYGLEYRYVTEYLTGKCAREEMERMLETAIHQFAKRQMTYLRGMVRRGVPIVWLDGQQGTQAMLQHLLRHLERSGA
ncbi:MAG: tRNA (adenosine(37)-N6)-dimethylallyltransferase MiaA [Bacteroidia bacterium]|nr:MAG: tRNA (adenosine(37)-N6)-dimethylallyltransferase MiaA [Bacteroidia bacterium]